MTLYDVCGDIGPNGFHDGRFLSFHMDWVTREASLVCDVLVGGLYSDRAEEREAMRRGTLTLSGLLYFVIEPPDPNYPFEDSPEGLEITADDSTSTLKSPPALPSVEGEGAFSHYFFVNDWNAFVYVAATGAVFAWETEGQTDGRV